MTANEHTEVGRRITSGALRETRRRAGTPRRGDPADVLRVERAVCAPGPGPVTPDEAPKGTGEPAPPGPPHRDAATSDAEADRCHAGPAAAVQPMSYREFPCGPCPIRADNRDNPDAKFPAERWDELGGTVRDPRTGTHPMRGDAMFGCHKGEPGTGDDLACAGWLVRFGADHVAVRLAVATGRLPEDALVAGRHWPPLHATWDDVVRHQTEHPDEPARLATRPDDGT